jgi:hypothetical protein
LNIANTEVPMTVVAKTCGCKERYTRKVTYTFIDAYHGLCVDKKDIILAELESCERLLKHTATDEIDKRAIESEIAELKMSLDMMA